MCINNQYETYLLIDFGVKQIKAKEKPQYFKTAEVFFAAYKISVIFSKSIQQ